MIAELGHFALVLALALAVAQAILPLVGAERGYLPWMRFAAPAAVAQFICVALSFACLTYAFVVSDFSLAVVGRRAASRSSRFFARAASARFRAASMPPGVLTECF